MSEELANYGPNGCGRMRKPAGQTADSIIIVVRESGRSALDHAEVAGSIPASPTKSEALVS
jgi:hypothetical protein